MNKFNLHKFNGKGVITSDRKNKVFNRTAHYITIGSDKTPIIVWDCTKGYDESIFKVGNKVKVKGVAKSTELFINRKGEFVHPFNAHEISIV